MDRIEQVVEVRVAVVHATHYMCRMHGLSTFIKNILLMNSHLHPQNRFNDEEFTDASLVTDDDKEINAQKIISSSCSTFFKNIMLKNSHLHPQNSFNDEEFTDVTLVTDDDKESNAHKTHNHPLYCSHHISTMFNPPSMILLCN